MKSEEGNDFEVEGVLNPAVTRGPDGNLYIFPRMVAKNNYSRIGIAKVKFDAAGDPVGVERLGIVLEPETDYEKRPNGGGGCEDPRITYVEPVQHYIMTYTAFGPNGPRIAMARSKDLFNWERMGLVERGQGRVARGRSARESGQPFIAGQDTHSRAGCLGARVLFEIPKSPA